MNIKQEIAYPEDIKKIMNYLEKIGTVNINEDIIRNLWKLYSDDRYCALWLDPTEENMKEFREYISEMDMQDYEALYDDDIELN